MVMAEEAVMVIMALLLYTADMVFILASVTQYREYLFHLFLFLWFMGPRIHLHIITILLTITDGYMYTLIVTDHFFIDGNDNNELETRRSVRLNGPFIFSNRFL
jgi:hypothetical protein